MKFNASPDRSILIIISELIFNFLPLIIASLIILYQERYTDIICNSDWSYISIILFGQTITKFFSGIAQNQNKKSHPVLLLILTMILVLGLIPSVIVLALLELSNGMKTWLIVAQWILLILSVFVFYNVGFIGQFLADNKYVDKNDHNLIE